MTEEYLFISDCHLDSDRPEISAAVMRFLNERAAKASRLYILGDLFEVWLGDDDPVDGLQPVVDSLQHLARDIPVFFLAGNRDFLLGEGFAARTGVNLLEEPQVLELARHRVLLIHGDTLCTDDHDYQKFRSMVRSSDWKSGFLGKPFSERQRIAARLRSESVDAMTQKSLDIMDVNSDAVRECFQQNRVDTIIHGHTHRPAVHRYDSALTRYVLGDWNPGPSYLSWDARQGFSLSDSRV
ncbi:MAG: UDP-2,3-diacylglucosamine diphosphatase [Gammaproteobacteria bacterium]|nr:UDP-2,3-diacylglucosamine diphosphatase [Gammaproteobacteria bacterium]MDH3447359.1 UDP-2,3-diacylglucosamine diphosphatase [Gammaproteobacteria bacterium]